MTFEEVERAMEFMLEQQARTDARLNETGELLKKVGLQLDILTADSVTFRDDVDKLHGELASVKDIAISHNQAIHQLFKLNEQTEKNFERLYQQRKEDFELHQQNFELLYEQREKDSEETRKKFELMDEQRQKDSEETRKKFELVDEQRQKDIEETRKKFELVDEQRQKDIEETRKKFELGDEQRRKDVESLREERRIDFEVTRKKFELVEEQRQKDMDKIHGAFVEIGKRIDGLTSIVEKQIKEDRNGRL